jgi:hypothetical protein
LIAVTVPIFDPSTRIWRTDIEVAPLFVNAVSKRDHWTFFCLQINGELIS